jgi:hypothetical protein
MCGRRCNHHQRGRLCLVGRCQLELVGSSSIAPTVADGVASRLLRLFRYLIIVPVFEVPVVTPFALRSTIFTAIAQVVQRAWRTIVCCKGVLPLWANPCDTICSKWFHARFDNGYIYNPSFCISPRTEHKVTKSTDQIGSRLSESRGRRRWGCLGSQHRKVVQIFGPDRTGHLVRVLRQIMLSVTRYPRYARVTHVRIQTGAFLKG